MCWIPPQTVTDPSYNSYLMLYLFPTNTGFPLTFHYFVYEKRLSPVEQRVIVSEVVPYNVCNFYFSCILLCSESSYICCVLEQSQQDIWMTFSRAMNNIMSDIVLWSCVPRVCILSDFWHNLFTLKFFAALLSVAEMLACLLFVFYICSVTRKTNPCLVRPWFEPLFHTNECSLECQTCFVYTLSGPWMPLWSRLLCVLMF